MPKRRKEMVCQLVLKTNWATHSHNQHRHLTILKQTRVGLAKALATSLFCLLSDPLRLSITFLYHLPFSPSRLPCLISMLAIFHLHNNGKGHVIYPPLLQMKTINLPSIYAPPEMSSQGQRQGEMWKMRVT